MLSSSVAIGSILVCASICRKGLFAVYPGAAATPITAPIIISLAFEVVIPRVYGVAALAPAPACRVSNGEAVFAPEIPKANKSAVGLPSCAVTVIVSLVSGLAAIAYQVNR